ncbi:MAG: sigma-70 family RNA polymerase sigma factor [Planctomycetes bacterium]|nr:sigma-70 family RNA polymerase sigma factor [Planctomycetota bacterium]
MQDRASNTVDGQTAELSPGVSAGQAVFDDAALVKQVRRGNMNAFGMLVTKYQDRIFNMTLRMCPRRAEAEELVQEAFLKALQRIAQFKGNSSFYTWLFRIAVNLTLSHHRRLARIRFHSLSNPDDLRGTQAERLTASPAVGREAAPHEAAVAGELKRRIDVAIEELDEEFRLMIILRDMEDMDYAEISRVTSLPVGTVKSRLHRARCALRDKLADLVGE